MGKWLDLPFDLVELIEDSVVLYADKVRVRAICLFWHLQLPKIKRKFPCLLQTVDDNVEASHTLFNPVDKKYYFLDVPDLQGKICKGSSHGWVVTIEDTLCNTNNKEHSNKIYLINPITSARIELPSRDTFPDIVEYNPHRVNEEYSFRHFDDHDDDYRLFSSHSINEMLTLKFIMSSDPSRSKPEDCVIAAFYGPCQELAYCTLKDKRWTHLPVEIMNGIVPGNFVDINFCRGKLHALLVSGDAWQVVVFENITGVKPNPSVTLIARNTVDPVNAIPLRSSYTTSEGYLVESSDGSCLYIIERFVKATETKIEDVEMCRTLYFKVRKVDPANGSIVDVKGIGEDVVILGMNTPISISSRNSVGYKGNCIYFSDSCFNYDRDHTAPEYSEIGVFSLEDGTLQPLRSFKSTIKFLCPPPIWVDVSSTLQI